METGYAPFLWQKKTHQYFFKIPYMEEFLAFSQKSNLYGQGGTNLRIVFSIYWWTWKTNIYLKNCWRWPIKNKILIFTMLHLKKPQKNTRRYHYFLSVYQKSQWYDLQFLRQREWKTEIGNFGSFFSILSFSLMILKTKILKKWKKCLEILSF